MKVTPVALQVTELTGAGNVHKTDKPSQDFSSMLAQALDNVNRLQVNSDKMTQQYLAGETTDIAAVLLAAEKANLALQLTVQIRNKIVEAYEQISNMQI